jgi:hypothetical protein
LTRARFTSLVTSLAGNADIAVAGVFITSIHRVSVP